jgi:hypothetical protein
MTIYRGFNIEQHTDGSSQWEDSAGSTTQKTRPSQPLTQYPLWMNGNLSKRLPRPKNISLR